MPAITLDDLNSDDTPLYKRVLVYKEPKPWDEYTKAEQDWIDAYEARMEAEISKYLAEIHADDLRDGTLTDVDIPLRHHKPTMLFLMEQRNKSFAYRAKQLLKKVLSK